MFELLGDTGHVRQPCLVEWQQLPSVLREHPCALDLAQKRDLGGPGHFVEVSSGSSILTLPESALLDVEASEADDCAPDITNPFVQDGFGQPKGLSVEEQVAWQLRQPHPMHLCEANIAGDLRMALDFEVGKAPSDIDAFRASVLAHWAERARELEPERRRWLDQAPVQLRPIMAGLHAPLLMELARHVEFDDEGLEGALRNGFPLIGVLPSIGEATKSKVPTPMGTDTRHDLLAKRRSTNALILGSLRQSEFDEDIWVRTVEDVALGAMACPILASAADLDAVTLSRRVPVREERGAGWRTRVVDDCSESGLNGATQATQRLVHDTLDVLVQMLLFHMRRGLQPRMWKRDVSRAFRRVPIQVDHLEFAWVAFMWRGMAWMAQHMGMPFGTTSAVHSWHRLGALLLAFVVRACLAPAARYVDDFYGASVAGVHWSGGRCLTVIAALTGLPCAPHKDADGLLDLVVLGAQVTVYLSDLKVVTRISEDKRARYAGILARIISEKKCSADMASKMAGRLSFATTVAAGRVGRAYIKPFYAQSNKPIKNGWASTWLLQASHWWQAYLGQAPAMCHCASIGDRPHVHVWTDAAGQSRMLAAVIFAAEAWHYTRLVLPEAILGFTVA